MATNVDEKQRLWLWYYFKIKIRKENYVGTVEIRELIYVTINPILEIYRNILGLYGKKYDNPKLR